LPFFPRSPLFPRDVFVFLAFCVADAVGEHGPVVSPWRRCAGTALSETVIVTKGFFFECVWWQSVTFCGGYCAAAADLPDGDTAVPTDASAPTASAPIPTATLVRLQLHLDRVISPRLLLSMTASCRPSDYGVGGKHMSATHSAENESHLLRT
jgi:hypothetical protein